MVGAGGGTGTALSERHISASQTTTAPHSAPAKGNTKFFHGSTRDGGKVRT